MRIPGEYWESWNYIGHPIVEQLISDADGYIWGTTNDVFKIDMENQVLTDLGKARVSRRVRAMTMGKDKQLYFIAGGLDEPCNLSLTIPKKTKALQTGAIFQ